MIRHIVMFELLENADGRSDEENIAMVKEQAGELPSKVPTIRNFKVVVNEPYADISNYDIAIICDFDDLDALDEYQCHPDHVKFASFIRKIRKNRACIDYEL